MNASVANQDRLAVSYHAAGQVVVSRYFGLGALAKIYRAGGNAFIAQTFAHPTTKFRKAVVGWAGEMAEIYHRYWKNGERPDPEVVLCEALHSGWEGFSTTDQESIDGHRQRIRAAKLAASILSDNDFHVYREANYIMKGVLG